jgi:23S rRNA pseudouridine1911/1915/1917 synthase
VNRQEGRVSKDDKGMRLDKWLALHDPSASREVWKKRIADRLVQVNGQEATPSKLLEPGDLVQISLPEEIADESPQAQAIPLQILYEDEWLAVIDKPAGLVVHPAHGHVEGTLVNALLNRYSRGLSDLSGRDRPGIVHRLDKDTSGTILIARDNQTHRLLADLFKRGDIGRFYEVVVKGTPDTDRGLIDAPIARGSVNRKKMEVSQGGKEARTEFELIDRLGQYAHLRCKLLTGRTHQIRVHLAYIGHPVLGDRLYGGRRRPGDPDYQLLHAAELSFIHPVTGRTLVCQSPLPDRFRPYLDREDPHGG